MHRVWGGIRVDPEGGQTARERTRDLGSRPREDLPTDPASRAGRGLGQFDHLLRVLRREAEAVRFVLLELRDPDERLLRGRETSREEVAACGPGLAREPVSAWHSWA